MLNIDPNQPLLFLEAQSHAELPQRVDLTYFKSSGKFYDQATLWVEQGVSLLTIWDLVEHLLNTGQLPGLIKTPKGDPHDFTVLVNAPGHPEEHPRLVYPRGPK
jgi:hypothetical protein